MQTRLVDPKALKNHPLAHLVPDMRPSEWQDFYNDVAARGIKVPLEILADGTVVDGRHRLKAALALGMKQVPVLDAPLNGDKPDVYMLKAAVLRRHLSDDQRAVIATLWKQEHKQAKGGDRKSEEYQSTAGRSAVDADMQHPTRNEATQLFNVARWKVDQASYVQSHAPDLAERVHSGDMALHNAYRQAKAKVPTVVAPLPQGTYDVIYADPPWDYEFSLSPRRSIEAHYDTLTVEGICHYTDSEGVCIQDKINADAILFLWVPQTKIREGLQVIQAWGFEYRTGAVWVKVTEEGSPQIGMGYYFREQHELLLVAKRGTMAPPMPDNRPPSTFVAPRTLHSRKPVVARQLIQQMYPGHCYLEVFATEKVEGWTTWP